MEKEMCNWVNITKKQKDDLLWFSWEDEKISALEKSVNMLFCNSVEGRPTACTWAQGT